MTHPYPICSEKKNRQIYTKNNQYCQILLAIYRNLMMIHFFFLYRLICRLEVEFSVISKCKHDVEFLLQPNCAQWAVSTQCRTGTLCSSCQKNDNDVIKSLTSPFLCPHTLGISESQIKWIPVLTSKEKIFDIIMADNRILDSAQSTKDYQVSNFLKKYYITR